MAFSLSYQHIFNNGSGSSQTVSPTVNPLTTIASTTVNMTPQAAPSANPVVMKKGDVPSTGTGLQYKLDTAFKSLNYQVDKLQKKKAYMTKECSAEDIQEYVHNDINRLLTKKRWDNLDMCFKWKFIDTYLKTFHWITPKLVKNVQQQLKSSKLTSVEYDQNMGRVKRLNIELDGNTL
jgi:hypothetical protein